jgi:hypothetical protein
MVPEAAVFMTLFNLPSDYKKKQVSMTPMEFCNSVAKSSVMVSIRYDSLSLVGEKVNAKWNPDELTFSVTGLYGI